MASALSETQVNGTIEQQMLEYFAMAANHLINTTD
jgi:truncated hemoglobin YjbI|tara:strand:- start:583 stop:687 length:105 start_codon:yes stop_codon:yes gene_type:complete